MKKYTLQKGILIAIEGIDGAGKTTQTLMLRDHFARLGYKVSTFKEPTEGFYGQQIKNLAINGRTKSPEEELELFIKDRIEDCNVNILPALKRNELVLIDRYYFSSVAYQGALGLDQEYILRRNEEIAIKPDLVIILDCAVRIGLSRIQNFRQEEHNHFEKEDYLEKVREIFQKMKSSYIQVVNSCSDADEVFKNTRNIVEDIIAPHSSHVVDQLNLFAKDSGSDKVIFFEN
jgi:dTMP kinase